MPAPRRAGQAGGKNASQPGAGTHRMTRREVLFCELSDRFPLHDAGAECRRRAAQKRRFSRYG